MKKEYHLLQVEIVRFDSGDVMNGSGDGFIVDSWDSENESGGAL